MFEIPARFTQGVTVETTGTLAIYPATEYNLTVYFITPGARVTITATKDGDDFIVTIPKATSATMAAGRHDWQAFAENLAGTERYAVGEGAVEVIADFSLLDGGFDARTTLEQSVANMRAVIAGTATADQKKYKYADREIERYDRAELINIYRFLKRELAAEQKATATANGKTFGGRVRVRFNGMV